jgi:hypothetical protein
MAWYMYFVWFGVGVVFINIAFQLYYGDEDISRVDQVKTGIKRVDVRDKIQTDLNTRIGKKVRSKKANSLEKTKTSTESKSDMKTPALGISRFSQAITYAMETGDAMIKRILQMIFSIISPLLYSIIQ